MSETTPAAAPAAAPSKRGKLIAIGLVSLMIVGGGGGAFWWWSRGAHAAATATDHSNEAAEVSGIVPLEPFLVNLADKSGSRFLRTTLKLVVADEKAAERLTENEVAVMRARSEILELLTVQTADHLVTPEGKSSLRKAICERVSPLTGGIQVTDVLFADFVVQF